MDTLRALLLILIIVFAILLKLFKNIIVIDIIAVAIMSGYAINHFFDLHLVFTIIVAVVLALAFGFIQATKVGFWIISSIISLAWALTIFMGGLNYSTTENDFLWTALTSVCVLALMLALHIKGRRDFLSRSDDEEVYVPETYSDPNQDIRELNRTMKRVADNLEKFNGSSTQASSEPLPEPTVYAEAVGVDENGTTIYEVKDTSYTN